MAARYFKHHLPNYGVFDEDRYFVPGDTLTVVRLPPAAVDVALTICEDLWQAGGPFAVAGTAGVGLVVNINGSPYELNKDDVRLPLVARRAAEAGATVAYVNMVGGQDELVFDGDSMIVAADGELLARAPQFAEHLLVHDLTCRPADPTPPDRRRRSARRGCGSRTRVAVDAARRRPAPAALGGVAAPAHRRGRGLAGAGAGPARLRPQERLPVGGARASPAASTRRWSPRSPCDALGPDQVVGVSMPSRHSSQHSRDDAADLAKRTGLDYRVEPIQPMVDALPGQPVAVRRSRWRTCRPGCAGVILMALSNQEGHLVLTTGNKSELAVGYSTLYGDSVGGFNPLKDVPKTLVWRLARWRNAEAARRGETAADPGELDRQAAQRRAAPGPARHATRCPTTTVLDAILAGYVDGDLGRDGLIAAGHDPALVDRVLRHGRPRRVQAPAVRAGHEDLHQGVRPGPPAADHQPVARDG